MLKRVYVDNYACLVNFEWLPRQTDLLLGANGSGKSMVFQCIRSLQSFVVGETDVAAAFPSAKLTRWSHQKVQTFELQVMGNGGTYNYLLKVEHGDVQGKSRVLAEEIKYDEGTIFSSRLGQAQLYRDDFSRGPEVSVDWTRSAMSVLGQRSDNRRLMWLREWFLNLLCVHPNPSSMASQSESEESRLTYARSNLSSWMRNWIQEDPSRAVNLGAALGPVIPALGSIGFQPGLQGGKSLCIRTSLDGAQVTYAFDELSEGQRQLIALYILASLVREMPMVLMIDEPDNYISLREIQPWLSMITEAVEGSLSQVILISHHPEVMDYLAPLGWTLLTRGDGGPARIRDLGPLGSVGGLSLSDAIARGWYDE